MCLGTFKSLIITWLLLSFVRLLHSDPQQSHWIPYNTGVHDNYPFRSAPSQELFQQDYQRYDEDQRYQYSGKEYKNVRYFQEDQKKELEILQSPSQNLHGYYKQDLIPYSSRNAQEFNYENLLDVTTNPSRLQDFQDSKIEKHEKKSYYQDYLPIKTPQDIEASEDQVQEPQVIHLKQCIQSNDNSKDEEILKRMNTLVHMLSEESFVPTMEDIEILDALENQMIAETDVPEETKRVTRQVQKQRPEFFWTLVRITLEISQAANDTKSAIQQIRKIINANFASENTNPRLSKISLVNRTDTPATTINENISNGTMITTTTTTTTEEPFRLTRSQFQEIIKRNLKGLIRLFNIEWRDALNQSQISVNEFHRDLSNQIRPYLQDNRKVN